MIYTGSDCDGGCVKCFGITVLSMSGRRTFDRAKVLFLSTRQCFFYEIYAEFRNFLFCARWNKPGDVVIIWFFHRLIVSTSFTPVYSGCKYVLSNSSFHHSISSLLLLCNLAQWLGMDSALWCRLTLFHRFPSLPSFISDVPFFLLTLWTRSVAAWNFVVITVFFVVTDEVQGFIM